MTRISRLVVLGDSLSDRGTLDKRKLLGFIPMALLSGLYGKSPKGRFTNGYLWGDYYCSAIAEGFQIEDVRKKLNLPHTASANADISDEFLSNKKLHQENETDFSLNNDQHILFEGTRFARFYCEGGLSAYDYSSNFTLDPTKEVPRLILSSLDKKRINHVKKLMIFCKKTAFSSKRNRRWDQELCYRQILQKCWMECMHRRKECVNLVIVSVKRKANY